MHQSPKSSLIIYLAASLASAFAFLFLVTPIGCDDFWFLIPVEHTVTPDGQPDPWQGVLNCWNEHFYIDNMRIPQILLPIILQLPRWLTAGLTSVVFTLSLWLMMALAPATRRSMPLFTLMALLVVFSIPWYSLMFVTAYQYNYIFPSMLILLSLWLFVGRRRPWGWMLALGFVTGAWHEAFAVATIAGAGGACIFFKSLRRADRLALASGAFIGFIILWMVPGTAVRMTVLNGLHFDTIRFHLVPVSFLSLWILCALNKKWHKTATDPLTVFCGFAAIAMIATTIYLNVQRSAFPIYVIIIPGICNILSKMISPLSRQRWIMTLIVVLSWAVICVHMVSACYYTYKLRMFGREIFTEIESGKAQSGVIFTNNFITREQIPVIAYRKPLAEMFVQEYFKNTYRQFYRLPEFTIIPTALKNYNGEGSPVAGNSGFRYYGGWLVAPYSPELNKNYITPDVTYSSGSVIPTRIVLSRFNGSDSCTYILGIPDRNTAAIFSGDIIDIKLNDANN